MQPTVNYMTPLENNESKSKVDPVLAMTIGNYQVTKKIGEGGMGSVYLAEHPLIGKKVALKVLHPEFSSNQDVVTRFFNEARAVNDIQHPNIVDIIDYGTIPGPNGDMVYFFMEHLDGNPLEDVIEEQSPIDPDRCLHICLQVADALAASHNTNIVHRDLKPDNIILLKKRSTDDFVKLLDFGIAKLTGDQPGSSRTRTGIVMGTPSYMSPEQLMGKTLDGRSDVYAMGVLAHELITGQLPFPEAVGPALLITSQLKSTPPAMSSIRPDNGIPPEVDALVLKMLGKQVEDRFDDVDCLRQECLRILRGHTLRRAVVQPPQVQAPSAFQEQAQVQPQRMQTNSGMAKRSVWVWVAVAAILLSGGVALYIL